MKKQLATIYNFVFTLCVSFFTPIHTGASAQYSNGSGIQRHEFSIGSAFSVPLLHLASVNMSAAESGMAYQNRPGMCFYLSLTGDSDILFGCYLDAQRYETDKRFVQYHIASDWDQIDHKDWRQGKAKTFWSATIVALTVGKQYYLTRNQKLVFNVGALLGYASLTSPQFQLNADYRHHSLLPIWPWFDYSVPETYLRVSRAKADGLVGGFNMRLAVFIKKEFSVSIGGDIKFTRGHFKNVAFDFEDNTDSTNPGKVSDFTATRSFHQSFMTTALNMTFGVLF